MNGDRSTLVKIILHGLQGPIDGKEYPSVMPALGANSDEWVASVVNYVRFEFGNAYRRPRRQNDTTQVSISIAEVARIRNENTGRSALWTMAEVDTASRAAANVSGIDNASNTMAKNNATAVTKKPSAKPAATPKKTGYAGVQPLLLKYTCLSCHHPTNKIIGPSYTEIAKKKYSVAQIIQLIQKPNPSNWPGFATKMPPMAHVPKSELNQIAQWIKSLEKAK
jgi:cytochrome c551/c552